MIPGDHGLVTRKAETFKCEDEKDSVTNTFRTGKFNLLYNKYPNVDSQPHVSTSSASKTFLDCQMSVVDSPGDCYLAELRQTKVRDMYTNSQYFIRLLALEQAFKLAILEGEII